MDNGKKIDALIRGIATRGAGFRMAVQTAAVAIVEHAKATNDCSRALKLCAVIPMASERVKLIGWFGRVSPINVTFTGDVSKRRVGLRKIDQKGYNPFDVDYAKANPYFEFGKSDDDETEALLLTSGDVNEQILKLAKRLQRNLDDGKVAANDVEPVKQRIVALRQLTVAAAA